MAINFPNSPVQGTTYDYEGVRFIYQDAGSGLGHWKVETPGTVGIATGAEINTGTEPIKYMTPAGFEASQYTDGAGIGNTPAGSIGSNNVQGALNELDSEKVAKSGSTITGQLVLDNGGTDSPEIKYLDSVNNTFVYNDIAGEKWRIIGGYRGAGGVTLMAVDTNTKKTRLYGSLGISVDVSGSWDNGKCLAIGDADTGLRQNGDGVLEMYANNTSVIQLTSGNIEFWKTAAFTSNVTLKSGSQLRLEKTADVSLSSTGHAFQIGLTNSTNMAIDGNEIQARTNGAGSLLLLNASGGDVTIGGNTAWHNGNNAKSLATNGYQKFASGLILQWGVATNANNITVTFPIAFPSVCRNVQVTQYQNSDNNKYVGRVKTVTKTQALIHWGDAYVTGADNYWFAIGY